MGGVAGHMSGGSTLRNSFDKMMLLQTSEGGK